MKKIICIHKKEVADAIVEALGCKYMIQPISKDQEIYTFTETDKLYKLLNNSGKYSKKDWFYDTKLRF